MKKFSGLFIFLLCLSFTACDLFGGKDVTFSSQDLIGTWQEDGTNHYIRFTSDLDTESYRFGYEWNLDEDVTEQDVLNSQFGNGWFKWKLTKSDLYELHFMDNDGALIPKEFVVTILTNTDLEYKDDLNKRFRFTKVPNK